VNPDTGWLPDLVYLDGEFRSGVAMLANAEGRITRFASDGAGAAQLAGRAMLPGLVNVHSHAFQRVIRGRTESRITGRDTFWTWRVAMYHAANKISPDQMFHVARMAFLEMALSGITTVGEFHYVHHDAHHNNPGAPYADRNELALQVIRAARDVGIRIVVLRTAYVRAGFQMAPDPLQARFITPRAEDFIADTEALRKHASVGVAPHSVRAVPLDYLREVARYAKSHGLPLHMHVAEQPAEVEASLAEYGRRPVEMLHDEGILDDRFTAIHAIHITDEEARMLGRSTVCACPTSERNLGDGAVPADRLLSAGARICFGSDSNIQIDILEDARLLEYHLRMNQLERAIIPGAARGLFECATRSGAESLQAPVGFFAPGHAADFFTVDLNDPSIAGARDKLLDNIVYSLERTAIRDVVVDGKMIVCDGRHALQEEITREFAQVQRSLW
jgi:formimidoylglutamate deiminase